MRNIEIRYKITGGDADVKKLADNIRALGGASDSSAPSVSKLEDKIAELEARVKSLSKAHKEHESSLEGFADSIVRKFESPISSARVKVLQLAEELGKMPAIVAGVAVGMVVLTDKLFKFAEAQAAEAQAMVNMSTRLGLSIVKTDELAAAAKIAGVDIGSLEGASRLLAITLEDTSGRGEKTRQALLKLGIDAQDAAGNFKETGVIITEVLSKLAQIPDTATRIRVAYDTLGRFAAVGLQPLIADYEQLVKLAHEAGAGTESEITEKLAEAAKQIKANEVAWEEFKKSLAAKIAPIEVHIIRYITDIVNGKPGKGSALNLAAPSPYDVVNSLGQADQFVKEAVPLPSRFNVPSADTTFQQAADEALKKRLNEEADKFKSSFDKTEDGMKTRLEKLKGDIQELVGKLSLRDPNRAADQKALNSLRSEQAGIEATLKAIEERKQLLKKLDELQKTANEKGGIDETLAPIRKLITERDELLSKLGPGSADRINEVYTKLIDEANRTRNTHLDKLIDESKKEWDKFVKERAEQSAKASEEDAKLFQQNLERGVKKEQEEISKLKPFTEFFTSQDKKRATFLADSSIKRAEALTTGPDEVAAANFAMQRRLELAKEIYDIDLHAASLVVDAEGQKLKLLEAEADFEEANSKARIENEVKLLEIRKKSIEEYRDAAGKVFDALKNHSVQSLVTGLATQQERAIFQNISTSLFKTVGGSLGQIGASSGLGGLLQGTLFDPRNASTPIDKNTLSLKNLTTSVDSLTATLGGVPGSTIPGGAALNSPNGLASLPLLQGGTNGFLGLVPGLTGSSASSTSGGIIGKLFGASTASNVAAFLGGVGAVASGNGLAAITGTVRGPGYASQLSTAGRIGVGVGDAAAVAGGALGVVSGIQKGGVQGGLGAAASALGAAAAFSGPAAPFLAAGALGLSLISSLFGDPKKNRANQLASELDAAQASNIIPRNGVNVVVDTSGREVSYDYLGRARSLSNVPRVQPYNVITGVADYKEYGYGHLTSVLGSELSLNGAPASSGPAAARPVAPVHFTIQVQTMDARSFADNAHMITNAVGKAIEQGHPLRRQLTRFLQPK